MTASARVPAAKILPAVEALRSVAAATETLRPLAAAKRMEAARVRLLTRRLRKAPAPKFRRRPLLEIRALKSCRGCAICERRPTHRGRYMVVGLLRPSGVAGTGRLVTAAGAFHWPVPRIAVWGAGDESACKYPVVSTTGLAIAVWGPVNKSMSKCRVVSTTGLAIAVWGAGDKSACKCRVVSTAGPVIAVRRPVNVSVCKTGVISTAGVAIAVRRPGNRSPSGRSALPAVRESPIGHCGAVRVVV